MIETTKPKKKNSAVRDVFVRMGVLGELLMFLWKRKQFFLIPMMLCLFFIAVLIIIGSSGPGGAFIYTLF